MLQSSKWFPAFSDTHRVWSLWMFNLNISVTVKGLSRLVDNAQLVTNGVVFCTRTSSWSLFSREILVLCTFDWYHKHNLNFIYLFMWMRQRISPLEFYLVSKGGWLLLLDASLPWEHSNCFSCTDTCMCDKERSRTEEWLRSGDSGSFCWPLTLLDCLM